MENRRKPKMLRLWIVGLGIVLGLFIGNWVIYCNYDNTNEFGDTFGVVNALFTGLAFVALVISIRQQNIDIKNQRIDIGIQTKALRIQGQELKAQKKEMKEQNLTLKLQRFENTFFNMLSLHHEIVGQINYKQYPFSRTSDKNPLFLGRHAFLEAYNKQLRIPMTQHSEMVDILHEYNSTSDTFQLGHYFRNLLQILSLVNSFSFDMFDPIEDSRIKYKYIGIVRSQLSRYEMLWLFYESLTEIGEGKLRPLIKEYAFLQDLNKYELPNPDHIELYSEAAFMPWKNYNLEE
jgi:hypothetical protein